MTIAIPPHLRSRGLLTSSAVSLGVGTAAATLLDIGQKISRGFGEISSIHQPLARNLAALDQCLVEAATDGWDGPGSRAVNPASFFWATRFIQSLPSSSPPPTISVDPDGEVDIGWDFGRRYVFAVSVSSSGQLAYAGLLGSHRISGNVQFDAELPEDVARPLAALLRQAG